MNDDDQSRRANQARESQPEASRQSLAAAAGTALDPDADAFRWAHGEPISAEQRNTGRITAIGIRPIRLRPMHQPEQPLGPWLVADIINISHGGLCLMVQGLDHADSGQLLELDLRNHPPFTSPSLLATVRWRHAFGHFTTLGIAFFAPLEHIPRLELERRSARRELIA